MLSVSTEAWGVTREAEWVWEEEEAAQSQSLGDGPQEDVKYLQKKKAEAGPKISSAAPPLPYLSSLRHLRPPSLIQIIHASS